MSKHTNDYINSIYVVQNPQKYDYRLVIEAWSYIKGYNEGYHKKQGTTYRSDIDVDGTFWIETYNREGELISKEHYYPNGEFKEEIFKEKNDNL